MDAVEFASQPAFHGALRALAEQACELRLRRIVLVHESFEGWPLDDRQFLEVLSTFVRLPGRQVAILGRGLERLRVRSPRFAAWRQVWGHGLDIRTPEDEHAPLPGLALADRRFAVELDGDEGWSGRTRVDSRDVIRHALDIDARMQRSLPAFPGSILGL